MMDKLPEDLALHSKTLSSWQELLVDSWMTCRLIVFKCFAQNLWSLLGGQLQLFECILDETSNGDQCSHRVGETNAFGMGGAQTNFGDQL